MRALLLGTAATLTVMTVTPSFANDVVIKQPESPMSQNGAGLYVWMDGSQQIINLPTFDLGWRLRDSQATSLGPSETYNPRVNGYGVSGAFGYVAPNGTFAPMWGENVRFELGTSYIHGDAAMAGRGPNSTNFAAQMLNGKFGETNGFGSPIAWTNSTLTTDYTAWTIGSKVAGDHYIGAFTLTPSFAVFSGHTSNQQSFFQEHHHSLIQPTARHYRMSSSLGWTDVGGRLGLDGKWQIVPWLSVGIGGNLGTAWRDTSLNASDHYENIAPFGVSKSSMARGNQTTAPLLANAEARVTIQPWQSVTLTAFGGLNFDSSVPGISGPNYTGPSYAPTASTPSAIKFESETSYYLGGRLAVAFRP